MKLDGDDLERQRSTARDEVRARLAEEAKMGSKEVPRDSHVPIAKPKPKTSAAWMRKQQATAARMRPRMRTPSEERRELNTRAQDPPLASVKTIPTPDDLQRITANLPPDTHHDPEIDSDEEAPAARASSRSPERGGHGSGYDSFGSADADEFLSPTSEPREDEKWPDD